MSANALDLSKLPPPAAVETLSFAALVAAIKADLIDRLPAAAAALDLESEPLVKLLEAFAYRELMLRSRINQSHLAATLAFATGADLDVAAANLLVTRQDGETDTDLRARAVLAQEGSSTAGPVGSYRFHALSASPLVADVAVTSPAPGEVRVIVLSEAEDGVADASLLLAVQEALSADDVRPLTDQVEVVSASVAPYSVAATLKIASGPDSGTVIDTAISAVQSYAAGQRKLNQRVTRAGLTAALVRPGVEDVVLSSPAADIDPDPETAPVLTDIDLTVEVLA